jgi:hypothetical protein
MTAKSLFRSALLALLLTALGAGLAWLGQQARAQAEQETKASAALLDAARVRLQTLQDREAEALAMRQTELEAQGFFAAATAASLDARLQAARKTLGLVETRLELVPPQPWGDGKPPLWQSEFSLEFGLNHEQEFIDFWRTLEWPGPLRLTRCELERASEAAPPRPGLNLKASCRLHWLSGSQPGESPPGDETPSGQGAYDRPRLGG